MQLSHIQQTLGQHRSKSYNSLKHYICKIILLADAEQDLIVPSSRELARVTGYSKTVVAKHLLTLQEEQWIDKKSWGDRPIQQFYVASASRERANKFNDFYILRPSKKAKILKLTGRIAKRGQELKIQERQQQITRLQAFGGKVGAAN